MDADHIRNAATTIFTATARPSLFAGLPQQGNDLLAQLAARHRIDRRVDVNCSH